MRFHIVSLHDVQHLDRNLRAYSPNDQRPIPQDESKQLRELVPTQLLGRRLAYTFRGVGQTLGILGRSLFCSAPDRIMRLETVKLVGPVLNEREDHEISHHDQ